MVLCDDLRSFFFPSLQAAARRKTIVAPCLATKVLNGCHDMHVEVSMIIVCNPVNVPSSLVEGLSHSCKLDVISITFTADHCGWVHTQT